MAVSGNITDNPFYQAVYNGSGAIGEKAAAVVKKFVFGNVDHAKVLEDYKAFREYLTGQRGNLDGNYDAALKDTTFLEKTALAKQLADAEYLEPDVLKKIKTLEQGFIRKSNTLQFIFNRNAKLKTAYSILAEAEEKLPAFFLAGTVTDTKMVIEELETQARSINMSTGPISSHVQNLKSLTVWATERLAKEKEMKTQRALKEYLDSDDAFRVKRELPAPERATFKRRTQPKPL